MQKAEQLKTLGNTAFQSGKFQEAVSLFTQAIQFNSSNHILFSNRSGAYASLGKFQQAYNDAHHSIILKPDYIRGYKRKGYALTKMTKYKEAIQVLQSGLKIDPSNTDLKSDLAQVQKLQSGPMPGAQNPYANQILMKLMTSPKTQHLLQKPGFMQKMQMCMANPMMLIQMGKTDPDIKLVLQVITQGFNAADLGGKMDQESPFEQIPVPQPEPKKQTKPQPPKSQNTKKQYAPGQQMKQKGNIQFKNRNFQKAIQYFDQAIIANPNEVIFQNNKAAALIELNRLQQAMAVIQGLQKLIQQGLVKSYQKKAKIFARKASILFKMGQIDQSLKWYQNSLLQNRQRKVQQDYKNVQKYKKMKQQQAYINPEIGEQVNQQGNNLYRDGKFPQALKKYQEAVKRNPKQTKYFSNKGMCYIKLMEFARARDQFERSIALDQNYIKAYVKKGDCHYFLKQYHKAIQLYQKGLKLDSQNTDCKSGIQKTRVAMMSSSSQKDQQQRAKHAMADPQIQSILRQPQIRNVLQDIQQNPNSADAMKALRNPIIAGKIQKLIQAGVIRTG